MDENILGRVVQVESEIQKQLEIEKKKSLERVQKARDEAEAGFLEEENRMRDELNKTLENARIITEEKTEKVLNDTRTQADTLTKIGDETLKKILRRHIFRILPGKYHDSKDVKG
jgi:vacuolar-type H+-ATPase subunit H